MIAVSIFNKAGAISPFCFGRFNKWKIRAAYSCSCISATLQSLATALIKQICNGLY